MSCNRSETLEECFNYTYALKGEPEQRLLLGICEGEAFQAAKDYGVCIQ